MSQVIGGVMRCRSDTYFVCFSFQNLWTLAKLIPKLAMLVRRQILIDHKKKMLKCMNRLRGQSATAR